MKRFILLAFLLSISLYSLSQNFNYSLVKDSIEYKNLVNPSYLVHNNQWNDSTDFGLKLPFDFNVGGFQSDSISIYPNGFIEFHKSGSISIVAMNNFSINKDSTNNFNSYIGYSVLGQLGNRQFVLEFYNFSDNKLSSTDFLTFQIRLNESNSSLEFLFGPSSYTNSFIDTPFHIGLINRNLTFESQNGIFINGMPNIIELKPFYLTDENMGYLIAFPYSGNRYTLNPF